MGIYIESDMFEVGVKNITNLLHDSQGKLADLMMDVENLAEETMDADADPTDISDTMRRIEKQLDKVQTELTKAYETMYDWVSERENYDYDLIQESGLEELMSIIEDSYPKIEQLTSELSDSTGRMYDPEDVSPEDYEEISNIADDVRYDLEEIENEIVMVIDEIEKEVKTANINEEVFQEEDTWDEDPSMALRRKRRMKSGRRSYFE